MQVNALNNTYAGQVSSHYSNGPFSTGNPIGLADEVSDDIISQKSEELRNEISQYNLRDMNPDDLRKLGGYLFESGEISGNALHTLYNLESFIKGSREHIGIDVKV